MHFVFQNKENKFVNINYYYCFVIVTLSDIIAESKVININASVVHLGNSLQKSLPNILENINDKLAKKISSFVDLDVSPCDDFYEYACGNWEAVTGHADYPESLTNFYMELSNGIYDKIERLLVIPKENNYYNLEEYKKTLEKAQKYYQTCKTTPIYDYQYIPEYFNYLESIGGFPAVQENWSENNFKAVSMAAHLFKIRISALFEVEMVEGYPFIPHFHPLKKFGLDSTMEFEDFEFKTSKNYQTNVALMKNILLIYGLKNSSASQEVVDNIIDLGRQLMNLTLEAKEAGGFHKVNIDDLINSTSSFDWNSYLEIIFESTNYNRKLEIAVSAPLFFEKIGDIIKQTDQKVLANYFALRFLQQIHVERRMSKSQRKFCIRKVMNDMSLSLARPYLKEYWTQNVQSDLLQLFGNLRSALKDLVLSAKWLGKESRAEALLKAEHITIHMGYVNDPIVEKLIEIIETLNVTDNYYQNSLNGRLINHQVGFYHYVSQANSSIQPKKVLNPLVINASFNKFKNSVQMYAADFQPPLYDITYPDVVKYGGIGEVMSHEMGHSFDISGIDFDAFGNKRTWLNESDSDHFDNISSCFVDQYSSYHFPEVNLTIDGMRTIAENMADNNGIALSFYGYKKALEQNKLDSELFSINLNKTKLQTFFLVYATKYCSTYYRNDYLNEKDSTHSFLKSRVNGPLVNFPEFSKVFNCPIGSKMNPTEKCSVF